MRLNDLKPSRNVRDQGRRGGGGLRGGGLGGGGLLNILPLLLGRKMGCGTILIIGAVLAFLYFSGGGLNLTGGQTGAGGYQGTSAGDATPCDTEAEMFACRVLTSTEQTWEKLLDGYRPTTLTFYQQSGQSGCGAAQSAMGPFYCPSDQGIYLDTSFFQQMEQQMGAGGDFAQAYVIAHEVGHHIQHLTGVASRVRQQQSRVSREDGNALQVRMELQADCYAGVWAGQNRDRIEPGDIEEGLRAAHAIGDDTLMRNAGRAPVESMFTHGTSEQRMAWLRKGLNSADPRQCDTFAAGAL